MKLIYTFTLADYQAAQQLHWNQTLLRRATSFAVYWFLPALLCSIALETGRKMGLFLTNWSVGYVLLFGFVLGLLTLKFLEPMRRSKMFRKRFERRHPPDQRIASIEIDNEGVCSAIFGSDEVKRPWSDIVGFAQNDKVTLLYLAKNRFLPFPTTALTSTEFTELNDLVVRHLPKGKP